MIYNTSCIVAISQSNACIGRRTGISYNASNTFRICIFKYYRWHVAGYISPVITVCYLRIFRSSNSYNASNGIYSCHISSIKTGLNSSGYIACHTTGTFHCTADCSCIAATLYCRCTADRASDSSHISTVTGRGSCTCDRTAVDTVFNCHTCRTTGCGNNTSHISIRSSNVSLILTTTDAASSISGISCNSCNMSFLCCRNRCLIHTVLYGYRRSITHDTCRICGRCG